MVKKSSTKYTIQGAYDQVYAWLKEDGNYNDADMEDAVDEIRSRLEENWPFKRKK